MENFLKEKIKKTIEKFNEYRSPEATVNLLSLNEDSLKIKVSCPCRMCGFYDYYNDFRIFLEEEGVKSKIVI